MSANPWLKHIAANRQKTAAEPPTAVRTDRAGEPAKPPKAPFAGFEGASPVGCETFSGAVSLKTDISQAPSDSAQRQSLTCYGCQRYYRLARACGVTGQYVDNPATPMCNGERCKARQIPRPPDHAANPPTVTCGRCQHWIPEHDDNGTCFAGAINGLLCGSLQRRCSEYQAGTDLDKRDKAGHVPDSVSETLSGTCPDNSFSYCPDPVGEPLGSRKEEKPAAPRKGRKSREGER